MFKGTILSACWFLNTPSSHLFGNSETSVDALPVAISDPIKTISFMVVPPDRSPPTVKYIFASLRSEYNSLNLFMLFSISGAYDLAVSVFGQMEFQNFGYKRISCTQSIAV